MFFWFNYCFLLVFHVCGFLFVLADVKQLPFMDLSFPSERSYVLIHGPQTLSIKDTDLIIGK